MMSTQPNATQLLDLHARVMAELGPEVAESLAGAVQRDLAELMTVAADAFRALALTPAPSRSWTELEQALARLSPAERRRPVLRRRLALVTGGAALAAVGLILAWLADGPRSPRHRAARPIAGPTPEA